MRLIHLQEQSFSGGDNQSSQFQSGGGPNRVDSRPGHNAKGHVWYQPPLGVSSHVRLERSPAPSLVSFV